MSLTMRKEIDGVKDDMKEMRAIFRRTMLHVAQMKGDISEMKANMVTQADLSAVKAGIDARMDAFSGLLLDSRQRWAVHADTLKQHDERLNKLEKRPS